MGVFTGRTILIHDACFNFMWCYRTIIRGRLRVHIRQNAQHNGKVVQQPRKRNEVRNHISRYNAVQQRRDNDCLVCRRCPLIVQMSEWLALRSVGETTVGQLKKEKQLLLRP